MTDEPYRWLEAVANRREYIRDQLKGATPVFAFSRPEGVLLCGVGTGQSKVFEVYDRQGLAALGHPVDIEKVRQTLIEAAHLEGFTRAPEDVNVRRLLSFSLSPALKTSFEQIFAAPLIVESILAEVGATQAEDNLARISYDGSFRLETRGVLVAHTVSEDETAATDWLRRELRPEHSLAQVAHLALGAWGSLANGKPFAPPAAATTADGPIAVADRVVELALLQRRSPRRAAYLPVDPASLS